MVARESDHGKRISSPVIRTTTEVPLVAARLVRASEQRNDDILVARSWSARQFLVRAPLVVV